VFGVHGKVREKSSRKVSEASSFTKSGERERFRERLTQCQWQEWDWVQLLGCFSDILLIEDVSVMEGCGRERNAYIALDAHPTS
jgi:hypothetical protein